MTKRTAVDAFSHLVTAHLAPGNCEITPESLEQAQKALCEDLMALLPDNYYADDQARTEDFEDGYKQAKRDAEKAIAQYFGQGATMQDVVDGTPKGQEAVDRALERSVERQNKTSAGGKS